MILPNKKQLAESEIAILNSIAKEFNVSIQPIYGTNRTIYAILGDERSPLMIKRFEGLDFVERIDQIQAPFKLMSKENNLAQHHVIIGEKVLGHDLVVIAGPCAIDPNNANLFVESAMAIKEAGADMLRGGVWKPRTSPHAFKGDAKSLDILCEARAKTGLPINTEVMDVHQLEMCIEAGIDCIQIGARNALNYPLLSAIGRATHDTAIKVLLKRGMHMGAINEFILAAEYIVAGGNPNIMLCPRGTQPAMDGYRNTPDEAITSLLKEKTWAPVVVDPSHSVGKAKYVPKAALAAISYGADGVLIECHSKPSKGLGDDPKQAITPDVLKKLIVDMRQVKAITEKYNV